MKMRQRGHKMRPEQLNIELKSAVPAAGPIQMNKAEKDQSRAINAKVEKAIADLNAGRIDAKEMEKIGREAGRAMDKMAAHFARRHFNSGTGAS